MGYGDRINADSAKYLSTAKKEENLLGILLIRPEMINSPDLKPLLSEDIFRCDFTKKVWRELERNANAEKEGTYTFGDVFTPEEMGRITQMSLRRRELSNNSESVVLELVQSLKKEAEQNDSYDGSNDAFLKRIEELKKSKK